MQSDFLCKTGRTAKEDNGLWIVMNDSIKVKPKMKAKYLTKGCKERRFGVSIDFSSLKLL